MSYRTEIEITIDLIIRGIRHFRSIDPWIAIQTCHAFGIICKEVMVEKRVMRGLELAELMDTTQASATRNIQLLCKYGLIEIHHSPMNKVDRLIKLTPKGRDVIQKIRKDIKKGDLNERTTKR